MMTGKRLRTIIQQPATVLNVLHVTEMSIHFPYISKKKNKSWKKIILLMIPNREGWNYLAVKKYLHC